MYDGMIHFDDRQGCAGKIPIAAALMIAIIVLVSCFSGCKSVSVVEKVNYKDSTIYHHKYDTTHVTITDSVHVEVQSSKTTENGTEITFGEGGGTYNSKTGEATNVTGVKENSKIQEQEQIIEDLRTRYEIAKASANDLLEVSKYYKSEYEKVSEQKRSGYDRFCSWWFWITAILILIKVAAWVMEKIPATAPYVMIARKFIPFL